MKKTIKRLTLLLISAAFTFSFILSEAQIVSAWTGTAYTYEFSCASDGGYREVNINANGGSLDWSMSQKCGYYIWYSDMYESSVLTGMSNGTYILNSFANAFASPYFCTITNNLYSTIGCGKASERAPQYDDKLDRDCWGGGYAYTSGNTLYYSIESIGCTAYMVLPTPSRTGYEFTGWTVSYSGSWSSS